MRSRSSVVRAVCLALVVAVASAACSSGGGESSFTPESADGSANEAGDSGADNDSGGGDSASVDGNDSESGSGGGGLVSSDQVTLTADPGSAYAEVDGERFVYEAAGSLGYTCEIGADAIRINFQTPEGQDLSAQVVRSGDGWTGQLTFTSAEGGQVQYSAVVDRGSGTLGVSDEALSYEGTADRIEDFDLLNATPVPARVAVNCALPGDGGDPVAEIDGTLYSFPLSGAQSVSCSVSPSDIDITVNRLALENLQLAIDMRGGPDDWIGSVFVITPEGNFSVTLVGDADGLEIDGSTVTYAGPIEGDAGEVEAEVAITCP